MDKNEIMKRVDHTLLTQTATWEEIERILKELQEALAASSDEAIIECLKRNVPTYHPERNMEKKAYNSAKVN